MEGKKKCWSCLRFSAYYTRGLCSLHKEKIGCCHLNNTIVNKNDSCEKWCCRRTTLDKRTKIAMNAIPEIYHKVAALEVLFKEELELEKIKRENG